VSSTFHVHQASEFQAAIQAHVRASGKLAAADWHVFVVRLIGRRAAKQEDFRRRVVFLGGAGVIVVDLVIVPRHDKGGRRVRGNQVAIRLVQRVSVPVIDDREDFLAVVLPNERGVAPAVGTILVDVVAGVEDEIETLVGDSAKGGEVSGLVVIAAANSETKAVDGGIRRWCGFGPANLTDFAAGAEAIPVFASWLQAAHFDVHGVTELWPCYPTPFCSMVRKPWSRAISHPTSTLAAGMPPPSSGSGASRVHSTTPSGKGSPDATPSVKG
jgi:hypothetical protein